MEKNKWPIKKANSYALEFGILGRIENGVLDYLK
jgi:hypothetical protein